MRILVTGAKGFVGKNLCATLENLRSGKDRTRACLSVEEIYAYDLDTPPRYWTVIVRERILCFFWRG